MRGKKKYIIPIFFAILVAAIFNNSISNTNNKVNLKDQQIQQLQQEINQIKTSGVGDETISRRVIIAKYDLKAGETLTSDKIDFMETSPDLITDDNYKSINTAAGNVLAQNVRANEPLLKSMMVKMEFNDFYLPVGMRAVSVPYASILGLASYHKAGARVDIISNVKNSDGDLPIIVQNAKILSIEGKDPTSSSIVFEVPAKNVRSFVNAIINGKIQIVSRNSSDRQFIRTTSHHSYRSSGSSISSVQKLSTLPTLKEVQNSDITGLPEPITPKANFPTKKVELIQANVKSELEF